LKESLAGELQIWTNHIVPPNDGGISLGQAAMAAFAAGDSPLGIAAGEKRSWESD
jgi:hydrogenase maturation factor HypF (carbamoyltransferase family)